MFRLGKKAVRMSDFPKMWRTKKVIKNFRIHNFHKENQEKQAHSQILGYRYALLVISSIYQSKRIIFRNIFLCNKIQNPAHKLTSFVSAKTHSFNKISVQFGLNS